MPTKKKTTTGPKAKLMKKNLAQLKAQAKKLKIKGFSTKKKEALVNSILMAQARNNKGKAKTTRKISSAIKGPNAALIEALEKMSPGQRKDLMKMYGLADQDYTPTGTRSSIKRMAKKRGASASRVMRNPARTGRVMMSEYNGWKNYETFYVNYDFGDVFQDVYDEYSLEGDYDFIFYADYFKDLVEDLLLGTLKSTAGQRISDIQSGMINAFLSEVDYDEIAKHFIE